MLFWGHISMPKKELLHRSLKAALPRGPKGEIIYFSPLKYVYIELKEKQALVSMLCMYVV